MRTHPVLLCGRRCSSLRCSAGQRIEQICTDDRGARVFGFRVQKKKLFRNSHLRGLRR